MPRLIFSKFNQSILNKSTYLKKDSGQVKNIDDFGLRNGAFLGTIVLPSPTVFYFR
jgi:hypothetical protein